METFKKLLKFAGIATAVLAVVAFILMMATPVAKYTNGSLSLSAAGTTAIFGADTQGAFGGTTHTNLAWTALVAWILVIVALVIVIAGIVLPLVKVTALDKVSGILNLVAVLCLVAAGILMFTAKATFSSANNDFYKDYAIGAGWVIAGILSIVGGVVAAAPAVVNFIEKK